MIMSVCLFKTFGFFYRCQFCRTPSSNISWEARLEIYLSQKYDGFCKSSLLYPTIGFNGELKPSQNHFPKVLTLVEYSSLLPTFHLRGIVTHSRTDDYPIGRVLRDQAQFPSNRFFVEAKTEPKFIFLAPQVL